jgi:hypothetical protein
MTCPSELGTALVAGRVVILVGDAHTFHDLSFDEGSVRRDGEPGIVRDPAGSER